jgi:hypothetical protein
VILIRTSDIDEIALALTQSLLVVIVIRLTQSVGGNNSGTYTLYMSPLMARCLDWHIAMVGASAADGR